MTKKEKPQFPKMAFVIFLLFPETLAYENTYTKRDFPHG